MISPMCAKVIGSSGGRGEANHLIYIVRGKGYDTDMTTCNMKMKELPPSTRPHPSYCIYIHVRSCPAQRQGTKGKKKNLLLSRSHDMYAIVGMLCFSVRGRTRLCGWGGSFFLVSIERFSFRWTWRCARGFVKMRYL